MKSINYLFGVITITAAFTFYSCNKVENKPDLTAVSSEISLEQEMSEGGTNPDDAIFSESRDNSVRGHLYLESNRRNGNTIFVFNQNSDGSLVFADEIASGAMEAARL